MLMGGLVQNIGLGTKKSCHLLEGQLSMNHCITYHLLCKTRALAPMLFEEFEKCTVGSKKGVSFATVEAIGHRVVHGGERRLHGDEAVEQALALQFQTLQHGVDPRLRQLVLIGEIIGLEFQGADLAVQDSVDLEKEVVRDTLGEIEGDA